MVVMMIKKIIDNIVRFAALLSVIALVTGFFSGDGTMLIIELVMIAIWMQMDHRLLITLLNKKQ